MLNGRAADADKLLDSYTEEVRNPKVLSDCSEFLSLQKQLE